MKKRLLQAMLIGLGISLSSLSLVCAQTSDKAAPTATPKTLEQVHGAMWPKSVDGYVTKYQCMKCHGDYEKLGQQTADLVPNPHKSHLGQVNCEDCHKPNLAKPVLMCNECHQFKIHKKAVDTAKK